MSNRLFDQKWFKDEVNPSEVEVQFLDERHVEFVKKVAEQIQAGLTPDKASVKVAKEMLGK